MNNWNSEDIIAMNKFIDLANKNKRINGTEITELYNRVLNKNLKPTSCGSCINQRYKELKQSYTIFQEELKKQEEKAKALEVLDELLTPTPEELEEIITPKKGRKKKGE